LKEKRADYGRKIVVTLSRQLTKEYGNEFSYTVLTRMVRFTEIFPKKEIVSTLSRQLSWRQNLRSVTQNTNAVRSKQKNPRQIRQILNSMAIGGEKIAKENQ